MTMKCITKCTLKLQRLSSGQLAKLAGGQSELIALKLQCDRRLWLGDTIVTASYVGQLSNFHHISTFNGKEKQNTLIFNVQGHNIL